MVRWQLQDHPTSRRTIQRLQERDDVRNVEDHMVCNDHVMAWNMRRLVGPSTGDECVGDAQRSRAFSERGEHFWLGVDGRDVCCPRHERQRSSTGASSDVEHGSLGPECLCCALE